MKELRRRIGKGFERQRHLFVAIAGNLEVEDYCRFYDGLTKLPGFTEWLLTQEDLDNPENAKGNCFTNEYLNEKIGLFKKERGL